MKIAIVLGLLFVGCAHTQRPPQTLDGGFPTPEARLLACLDLQDHLVDYVVDDYLKKQPEKLTLAQRMTFRQEWGDELAKSGAFDRFQAACITSLTQSGYSCSLNAPTPAGVGECLKKR